MSSLRDVLCLDGGRYTPKERSFTGKFLLFQGVVYHLLGFGSMFLPALMSLPGTGWGLVPPFEDDERGALAESYFRAACFCVGYIGLFYDFAGLSDSWHFAAVSSFIRPGFVVPFFTVYLGVLGHLPLRLAIFFGLADTTFALLTHISLTRDLKSKVKCN